MSSAILYLAIIAIWAGVLIPRWLRRDSAHSHLDPDVSAPLPADDADTADDLVPVPDSADELDASPGDFTTSIPEATEEYGDAGAATGDDTVTGPVAPPSPGQARRRILAARRRLLWMMLALEAAADVLAASGLAAWWVIAPPTVMLAGYLLLLREAAQADAERDARERDAAQAREHGRHAREAVRTQLVQYPPAAPVEPAMFAAAPVPEDYPENYQPGRDFTPGGRYTISAEDDAYDQYTEERPRAVGD